MTVNDILEKIEELRTIQADLRNFSDYKVNEFVLHTAESACDAIEEYIEELMKKKVKE